MLTDLTDRLLIDLNDRLLIDLTEIIYQLHSDKSYLTDLIAYPILTPNQNSYY
jgi:hypothetical protein